MLGYLDFAKDVEKVVEVKHEAGSAFVQELCLARYHRIDAEIRLLRALPENKKAAFVPAVTKPIKGQADDKLPAVLRAKRIDVKDDTLRKLLKERYNEAAAEVMHLRALNEVGQVTAELLFDAGQRLMTAGLELSDKPDDMVAFLSAYSELPKQAEKVFETKYVSSTLTTRELHQARYHRIGAEIQLLRAKRDMEKAKGK
jgi:hypothetical protein